MGDVIYLKDYKKYYVQYISADNYTMTYEIELYGKSDTQVAERVIRDHGPLIYIDIQEYDRFLFFEEDLSLDFNYPDYWDDT